MAIVAVDIDGCLARFDEAACDRFGWDCDRTIYDYHVRWPDKCADVDAFVSNPKSYMDLKPLRHAASFAHLVAAAREIIYVTARPAGLEMLRITKHWLKEHDFPPAFIEIIGFQEKPGYVAELEPVWVLEDSPRTIQAMRDLGLRILICDQPWNRESLGPRVVLE